MTPVEKCLLGRSALQGLKAPEGVETSHRGSNKVGKSSLLVWGYSMEKCEATSGNILHRESCLFTTFHNTAAVGLCVFLCKTGGLCQVPLMPWYLIYLPEYHNSHSTWLNLLGILDWTKSRPLYYSAFHLTLHVPGCLWQHISVFVCYITCFFYLFFLGGTQFHLVQYTISFTILSSLSIDLLARLVNIKRHNCDASLILFVLVSVWKQPLIY